LVAAVEREVLVAVRAAPVPEVLVAVEQQVVLLVAVCHTADGPGSTGEPENIQ